MASETENYNMEICPTILTNRYLAPPLIFGLLMASPSVFSVTFDQVQSDIFDVSCASSSCHGGSRNPTLTSGQSFANIVNVASTQGTDYVEPGDPDQSYIMNKVLGTGVGGQMPPSGALSDAKIQLLRDWIAQGASSGLYLGRSYHMNGDVDKALLLFDTYRTKAGSLQKVSESNVDYYISQCKTAKELMAKPVSVTITNMGEKINSAYDDKSPVINPDGKTIYFNTRRPSGKLSTTDNEADGKYFDNIYMTTWNDIDNEWNPAEPAVGNINYHESHYSCTGLSFDG